MDLFSAYFIAKALGNGVAVEKMKTQTFFPENNSRSFTKIKFQLQPREVHFQLICQSPMPRNERFPMLNVYLILFKRSLLKHPPLF